MKKTITALFIGLACAASSSLANAEDLLSVYQQAQANDPVVLGQDAVVSQADKHLAFKLSR